MTRVSDSAWKLGREHLLLARQSQAQGREDVCGEVFGRSRGGGVGNGALALGRKNSVFRICMRISVKYNREEKL